ncbi:uncharacterized protein MONBRDRAFT_6201 [Monosiga brevicollis MX1]|uniref:Transmembrane protein 144 n=1 Tax=Monosiga brevicollis TaxID=81824 RepID=A9UT47_MONBE|nr:uncharacterized protein MONBRDRAFT_6201 [Monosiga brevicollis MX1]EDQ91432.1 predicted protein [Monosiga brevicollis MX1]|eukprot:XP_001743854.1 hypothetical protein [Monosiga brevicollis MX1]
MRFLVSLALSVVLGSNYVPVKRFEMGDGVFFQWILCITVWMCGAILQLAVGVSPFVPLAATGGMAWSMGNLCVVLILRTIGLAQGMLIWGTANMIMGWGAARFGFFGITPELPQSQLLQYLGVAMAALSALSINEDADVAALSPPTHQTHMMDTDTMAWCDRLSDHTRRAMGLFLSIFSGIMYSFAFDPAQSYMDRTLGASQQAFHYVFSQFSGILMGSTLWFVIYSLATRSRPNVSPEVILPSMASGVMWAIAQTCFMVANQHLSQAIAYPIITAVPGTIGALWGVLVFKEIRGLRNMLVLTLAFAITFTSVALTAMANGA